MKVTTIIVIIEPTTEFMRGVSAQTLSLIFTYPPFSCKTNIDLLFGLSRDIITAKKRKSSKKFTWTAAQTECIKMQDAGRRNDERDRRAGALSPGIRRVSMRQASNVYAEAGQMIARRHSTDEYGTDQKGFKGFIGCNREYHGDTASTTSFQFVLP